MASLGAGPRRDAFTALTLAVLAALCYVPALSGGFVWDDVIFSEEPAIHAVSGLKSIWFSPADIRNEGHYWPLVYTSFWLEHQLWGLWPAGHHAVNIVLHVLNCLLLWRLLERLRVPGAVVIAAVFAVHPVHVESVAWIIERKDVLSALCYLSAVLVWVRFVEEPRPARYTLALLLFAGGLLSKSVVVTLPAALLVWHWWQYGRITWTDVTRLAPLVAIAVGITAADLSYYTSREPLDLGYTLAERVLIAGRALWFYVGKLLWPADLAVIHPLWEIDAGNLRAWAYPVAAAALAAGLWLARRRIGRGPLAGVLYFAVTLAPVLGFVDYGYMQFSFVADRFQYLAGIGVLAVLIGGAAHGLGRLPEEYRRGARWSGAVAVVALVVVLGALTWRQAGIYRDDVTLFSHVVAHNPQARDAHLNLGVALFKANRFDEGLEAGRIALRQRPDSIKALTAVGRGLIAVGRPDEAEELLRRAVRLDPRDTRSRQNLAESLRKQERFVEAVEWYRAVLAIDDEFAPPYAGMGIALFGARRYEEAIAALERALSLDPRLPTAAALHLYLGRAARELGRFDEAAGHLQRAAEIEPANVEPLLELANLRSRQGRSEDADRILDRVRASGPDALASVLAAAEALRAQREITEAITTYRTALEIDPNYAPALAGLGIALLQSERYEEAIEALEQAVALQPDLPISGSSAHVLLGLAAQHLGRPDAAEHFERALRDDPSDRQALEHLAAERFGQQRYEETVALYRTMIEMDPDNALTHSNLGAALYHLGRLAEALDSIERALALDPDLDIARVGRQEVRKALAERQD